MTIPCPKLVEIQVIGPPGPPGTSSHRTLKSFGWDGLATDATVALQLAAQWMQESKSATVGIGTGMVVPAVLDLGDAQVTCTESLNLQTLNGPGWGIVGHGAVITASCDGKVFLDCLGSRFGQFSGLTIYGDAASPPRRLMQYGRLEPSGNTFFPGEGMRISNCFFGGSWTECALYSLAGETTSFDSLVIIGEDTTGNAYGIVIDGCAHLARVSDFQLPSLPADTAVSSLQHTLIGTDVRMVTAGIPYWFIQSNQIKMVAGYGSSPNDTVIKISALGSGLRNLDLDVHCETLSGTPGLQNCISIEKLGSAATVTIAGLRFRDQNTHAANAIIKVADSIPGLNLLATHIEVDFNQIAAANGLLQTIGAAAIYGDIYIPEALGLGNATLNGRRFSTTSLAVPIVSGPQRLTGANSFTGEQLFTPIGVGASALTAEVSNEEATPGPDITLRRLSASPAVADFLGRIRFYGNDAGGAVQEYASMRAFVIDPSVSAFDGALQIVASVNSVQTLAATFGANANTMSLPLRVPNYTVATLPAAGLSGVSAASFVTDATQTLAAGHGTIVAGGGSNKVPVYSDGVNWMIG